MFYLAEAAPAMDLSPAITTFKDTVVGIATTNGPAIILAIGAIWAAYGAFGYIKRLLHKAG